MIVLSFILDLIFGDPYNVPHPIVFIGNIISKTENIIRSLLPKKDKYEFWGGAILFVFVCALSFMLPYIILYILIRINFYLGFFIETYFCYTLLAVKSLKKESMKVYYELENNDIEKSRLMLSYIVGRDTKSLDENHIICATVETIAENTTDGVIAPMFYMMLGGAPLMFLYKAVNTMDSMIGYKNEKYLYFGTIAAKADDILNFIPARISALFMIIASFLCGFDFKNAIRIYKRDRLKHSSPNSAHTESVCSGALNIQLAGDAYYFGKLYKKEFIGDGIRKCNKDDIIKTNRLLYVTSFVAVILFVLFKLFIMVVLK